MIYPAPGLSEQDPDMLWKTVVRTTKKLVRDTGVEPSEVVGIGIGAQMFDLIPVDENFKPLTNMITWMDLRAVDQADRLLQEVGEISFTNGPEIYPEPRILFQRSSGSRIHIQNSGDERISSSIVKNIFFIN